MTTEIRPIVPDEFDAFMRAEGAGFGQRPTDAELEQRRTSGLFEFEHSLAAFEDGQIVGTAGAFTFELTVPGGEAVPLRGVSWVSVLPTHRRRGILTALMRRQLDDIAAAGEPMTMLTASESGIYGRFGYGIATSAQRFEIERPFAALARRPDESARLRFVETAEAVELFGALYDRLRRSRPGMVNRTPRYWEWSLTSPYMAADGASFYAVVETEDRRVAGAAHYQVKPEWANGLPNGTLTVREAFADSPQAYAAIWSHCFGVDLVRTIRAWSRPVDDPVRWMLADSRRLHVTTLADDLYLRLLDIPAALTARAYSATDDLVLDVADAFRPESAGRYRLRAGTDGAECARSDAAPDLELSVTDLGAAYLGGVPFATLAMAGRVEERTPGAIARADALFATPLAPYCGTSF